MTDIKVNVAMESLELTSRKAVTGEIYFESNGTYFPELHWNDFIIVVLNWWLRVIQKIYISNVGITDEFLFMDGPFLVRGCKVSQETIHMDFIKSQLKGETILFSSNCRIGSFSDSVLATAKKIVAEVDNRKWDANELDKLRISIRVLSERKDRDFL